MLEKETEKQKHNGCPFRTKCTKKDSQCCYLLGSNTCYLNTEQSEEFI